MINLQTHKNIERLSRAAKEVSPGYETIQIRSNGTLKVIQMPGDFLQTAKMLLIDGSVTVKALHKNVDNGLVTYGLLACDGGITYEIVPGKTMDSELSQELLQVLELINEKVYNRLQTKLHIALYNAYAGGFDINRGNLMQAVCEYLADYETFNGVSQDSADNYLTNIMEFYAKYGYDAVVTFLDNNKTIEGVADDVQ